MIKQIKVFFESLAKVLILGLIIGFIVYLVVSILVWDFTFFMDIFLDKEFMPFILRFYGLGILGLTSLLTWWELKYM